MGKVWIFGGDSDSEYTEYEDELICPGKVFNMSTKDAIGEKALRRHVKMGIPRRKGYYQLQTRNSSRARPISHFYDGHHWEVGPMTFWDEDVPRPSGMARPGARRDVDEPETSVLVLEHTTRRLTAAAVDKAVEAEKSRRIRQEAREKEVAARLYAPLNNEFMRLIAFNMDESKKEEQSYRNLVEAEKEDVLQQLLHHKNQRTVDDMMEEERNRRLSLMHDMTDSDKCTSDMELLKTLKGLSKTAKMMQTLQQELMGAAHDLEEVSHEEDHAVNDLFSELKDDFVASFKRATLLMKFHMAEENEKRRRMAEAKSFITGKKDLDQKQQKAMQFKGLLQEELTRVFAGVIQDEAQKEAIAEENSHAIKFSAQEELLHRLAIQEADQSCAKERIRRIKELEEEMRGRPDPVKEHIKDIVLALQEEMLVQKFHGKKVMFRKAPESFAQKHYEGETLQDRKLRNARMKSRRQSCVVTGF